MEARGTSGLSQRCLHLNYNFRQNNTEMHDDERRVFEKRDCIMMPLLWRRKLLTLKVVNRCAGEGMFGMFSWCVRCKMAGVGLSPMQIQCPTWITVIELRLGDVGCIGNANKNCLPNSFAQSRRKKVHGKVQGVLIIN